MAKSLGTEMWHVFCHYALKGNPLVCSVRCSLCQRSQCGPLQEMEYIQVRTLASLCSVRFATFR